MGPPTGPSPDEIRFNTMANGGLFDVTFGSGLTESEFSFEGPQLFGGTTAAPVFSTASFNVASWTFSDPANFDVQTPAAGTVGITAAPEPSAALLFSGGFALLVAFRFRKSRIAKILPAAIAAIAASPARRPGIRSPSLP